MYPSAIEQLVYSNRGFRKSATSSQEAFDRWAVREAMRRAGLDGYLKKATLTGYPGTAAAKELMGGQPSPDELFSDSYVSDSFAAPQPTYNPSPEYDGSLDIVQATNLTLVGLIKLAEEKNPAPKPPSFGGYRSAPTIGEQIGAGVEGLGDRARELRDGVGGFFGNLFKRKPGTTPGTIPGFDDPPHPFALEAALQEQYNNALTNAFDHLEGQDNVRLTERVLGRLDARHQANLAAIGEYSKEHERFVQNRTLNNMLNNNNGMFVSPEAMSVSKPLPTPTFELDGVTLPPEPNIKDYSGVIAPSVRSYKTDDFKAIPDASPNLEPFDYSINTGFNPPKAPNALDRAKNWFGGLGSGQRLGLAVGAGALGVAGVAGISALVRK
ncbi:MAG: hypothetical protein EBX40_07225, partial [Gammaproteobacteria bacterium]|nr:hypothetical protein [Gammaproteobacteria bacterium]